jgi:hypothetical protein
MLHHQKNVAPPDSKILADRVHISLIPTSPKANELRERFKVADGLENSLIQSVPSRRILTLPT